MAIPEIVVRRLHNQQLIQTRFERPEDLVAWMGAVQAQEYAEAQ